MPLAKQSDTIINTYVAADGKVVYSGVRVQAFLGDVEQQLYSDGAGTPVSLVQTDANGLYSFWIEEGTYNLRFSVGGVYLGDISYDIFNPASKNAVDTAQLTADQSNAARAAVFWSKIRAQQEDVNIIVCSDSTGNENTEWPYLMCQWLATQAPTHSVIYRRGTEVDVFAWGSPVTISAPVGAVRTIYMDVACKAGTTDLYCDGGNAPLVYDSDKLYDLAILNHGHNYGTLNKSNFLSAAFTRAVANFMTRNPAAQVFVTLQNPNLNAASFSAMAIQAWRRVAARLGCGVIDAYDRFMAQANPADWLLPDLLHPSAAGSLQLWLPAVQYALAENRTVNSATLGAQVNPLTQIRRNLVPNPVFSIWTAGASAPDGWTLSACNASKDTGPATGNTAYVLKLSPTGDNARLIMSLTQYVKALQGRTVTVQATVRSPLTYSGAGPRISISSNNGSASVAATSTASTGLGRGGFMTIIAEPLVIQKDAASITLTLFAGDSSDSAAGRSMWVESIALVIGDLPTAIDFANQPAGVIEQYYSDQSVTNPAGFTGTVTTNGTTITLTGGTAPNSRAMYSFPTVIGRQYRTTWTQDSVTGAAGVQVHARAGSSGNGTTITSANGSVGSLTYTATSTTTSIVFIGGSNVTAFQYSANSTIDAYTGISIPVRVPLIGGRNTNGIVLDATGGVGRFSVSSTPGTGIRLLSEAAQNNTKTDQVMFESTLPSAYIAGKPLLMIVNAQTTGTGTAGTRTLRVYAYLVAADGSQGANLGPAAQNLTASAADYSFAITSTSLNPGDKVVWVVEAIVQETANTSTLTAQINSMRLT